MSQRLVLDASAALEAVVLGAKAKEVFEALERAAVVLVPGIFHSEVANALWKYVRSGRFDLQDAVSRFESAATITDRTVADADLAGEALVAAVTHDHSVYDMLYAVLARRFGCTVCTMDKRLGAALERMDIDHLTLRL